jgi:uncharacterized protein (UPF0276 family)
MSTLDWPRLGYGVGLRAEHFAEILAGAPRPGWFEALTENYLDTAGRPLQVLEALRRDTPLVLHGVALSIGSTDPLDRVYLAKLRDLATRLEPALITDHLCWSGVDGRSLYDLLPLPYDEATLAHVVERVQRVQDALGRRIALENPSAYVAFRHSTLAEPEFLAAVAAAADCGILLDVNNVHVSACNLGFDAAAYIDALPAERLAYVHVAGFTDCGSYLFDTHSAPVHDDVWALYRRLVGRCGTLPTLVEWDAEIPPFARLCAEAARAAREAHAASPDVVQPQPQRGAGQVAA